MSFDVKKHLIKVQGGREYLPVAARLVWFRGEHPDWGIITTPVEINMEKLYAIFSCQIFNAEGKLMATATKHENVRGFGDFLEKAETGAVGRALAYCGYGTQFAPELEEESRYADAPRDAASATAQAGAAHAASPTGNRCSCGECPNTLTAGQVSVSMRKYGAAYCLLHQRNATPIAQAQPPQKDGAYAHA